MKPRAHSVPACRASPSCRQLCFVLQVQGAVLAATRHADGGQLPGGWVGHRLEPAETGGFTVKPPVSRPLAGQHGCRWPSSCSCCHPGSLLAHRCPHLCRVLRYVRERREQPHAIAQSVRARELEHRACTRILPRVHPCACLVCPPEALRSQIATRALRLIACCSRRCDRRHASGSGSGSGDGGVSGIRRSCVLCAVPCAMCAVRESYSCWWSCVQL